MHASTQLSWARPPTGSLKPRALLMGGMVDLRSEPGFNLSPGVSESWDQAAVGKPSGLYRVSHEQ